MATNRKKLNVILWVIQIVLVLLYLFTGGAKLILPIAALTKEVHFPGLLLRFIGACEVLGAMGLLLPGLFRIGTYLTPLAAAGLVIIMIGATTIMLVTSGVAQALMPLCVGLLVAFVGYGRWRLAPVASRESFARSVQQAAN
jgi:hypothetical protein